MFRKKKEAPGCYLELEEEVRKTILSASGNVGGNVCDALLPYADSEEQRRYLMMEAGFFGVAVASYFYAIRYQKQLNSEVFAKAVFEDYKDHMVSSISEIPEKDRQMLEEIYTRHGFPAIEEYMRLLSCTEVAPEEALSALNNELVDRVCRLGGITFSARAKEAIQSKNIEMARALMQSYRYFFG